MDKQQPLPIFAKIENLTYTINNHFKRIRPSNPILPH